MNSFISISSILAMLLFCHCSKESQEDQNKNYKVANPPRCINQIIAIKIPEVQVKNASLNEVISFVAYRINELDPRQPAPSGISFITKLNLIKLGEENDLLDDNFTGEKRVDYKAKNVRVDKLLGDLSRLFDVEFYVTNVGIIITPREGTPFPNAKAKKGTIYYSYKF